MIGDEIEITILSVAGDKVRIGIAAPREVDVFRKEVYATIDGDGRKPATIDGDGEGAKPKLPEAGS